ncbi:MAG: hypothetical protein ACYC26_04630 [Phycisphaerales bacterium]
MKVSIHVIVLLLWACCVCGCGEVRLKGGRDADQQYQGATTWPFVPVAMRVHPFSAIEYEKATGTFVLNARIELLDRAGDITKGVGDFRFELYRAPREAGLATREGTLEYSWEAPLVTLEENRQHFDPITRTYLFRLKLDQPPQSGTKLVLVTQFTDPGGRRLSAQAQVSVTEVSESPAR